jgi:hypothetical protein
MNKVLLFWRIGTGGVYTIIGRIPNDYKMPADLKNGSFHEGIITEEGEDLDDMIIYVPFVEQTVKYAGDYQFKAI